jgi:hypothetical protein
MEVAAILKIVDTVLGLIAAGVMGVQRAREIFADLNARLVAIHAEGRTMSAEEFRAYIAEGDVELREALGSVDEILGRLEAP